MAAFVGLKYNTSTNQWSSALNNGDLAYTHWATPTHPNTSHGHCARLDQGFWHSTSCDHAHVLCQTKAISK